MIKIKIDRENLSLTVMGHADYAEHGKDIVCAGVSSLVNTLALYAQKKGGHGNVQPGYAEIDVPYSAESSEVFNAISDGLEGTSQAYDERVCLT